jgi:hypothetical protein
VQEADMFVPFLHLIGALASEMDAKAPQFDIGAIGAFAKGLEAFILETLEGAQSIGEGVKQMLRQ